MSESQVLKPEEKTKTKTENNLNTAPPMGLPFEMYMCSKELGSWFYWVPVSWNLNLESAEVYKKISTDFSGL